MAKLSDRQAVIYRLLTDKGLTPPQVAAALNISTQRVYQQMDAIRGKGYELDRKYVGKGAGDERTAAN